ncbi:MAG: PLP-dependent aminotransferase family protein [Chitinophagaceae bacterium]|nr:MAG: PLP-dependent aminotransferase family protein [Chitinophagaceae bacterium]
MLSEFYGAVLNRQECTPLHTQIERRIKYRITNGDLYPGLYLGTLRDLAKNFHVNRNTVIKAVENLMMEGYLFTRKHVGVFIAEQKKETELVDDDPGHEEAFLHSAVGMRHEHHFALMYKRVSEVLQMPYASETGDAADYTYLRMRQGLTNMLNLDLGLSFRYRNVCYILDHGKFFLLLGLILQKAPGCFIMENPGNNKVATVIQETGMEVLSVGVCKQGIDLNELENVCKTRPVSAVYLNTRCQFPTTITLPEQAGKDLVDLSEKYGFYIVEADYVHEFWYGSKPYPLLAGRYPDARIIYFAPYSRTLDYLESIGVVAGAPTFMDEFIRRWRNMRLHHIHTFEKTVEEMLFNRRFHRLSISTRTELQKKRDYFAGCLLRNHNDNLHFNVPQAGLAFWLQFAPQVPLDRLFDVLHEKGYPPVSPSLYCLDQQHFHGIRVGFTTLEKPVLERLARIICHAVE